MAAGRREISSPRRHGRISPQMRAISIHFKAYVLPGLLRRVVISKTVVFSLCSELKHNLLAEKTPPTAKSRLFWASYNRGGSHVANYLILFGFPALSGFAKVIIALRILNHLPFSIFNRGSGPNPSWPENAGREQTKALVDQKASNTPA